MSPKLYAADTETCLIDRGPDLAPPLACTTYCDESFVPGIVHAQDGEDFVAYLYDECIITGGNYAFDACVHMRAYPRLLPNIFKAYRENRVRDTFLSQKLIDLGQGCLGGYRNAHGVFIEHRYSLAALYERYGFGTLDKSADTWRLRYGELVFVPLRGRSFTADPRIRFEEVYGKAWSDKALLLRSGEAEWPEAAEEYAKLDAKATLQVDAAQQQFSDFLTNVYMQTRYALSRQLMSITGMITDAKVCAEYLDEVKVEIVKAKALIESAGLLRGPDFEPKSKAGTKDVAAARGRMVQVCKELGIEPKLTDKEGISLDQEATRDTGDPILKAYSTFTSASTIIKKVTEIAEGSKGLPLQTSFDMVKENGRCASRKPSPPLIGVQMHNLPKTGKMRRCFVAPPGFAIVSIDFNMHELVTVSQVALWAIGKSNLAEALNANRDVHCDVASILLDCTYEEVLANKKVKGSKYQKARDQSKEVNFGGWGVMTPRRLMLQMNRKRGVDDEIVTEDRAIEIMQAWEARWEPQAYFDFVKTLFPDHNQWGRATYEQYISGRIRAHADFPAVANGLFSGLATDASQHGDTEVTEACYLAGPKDPLYQARPVMSVHDEILMYIRLDRLHEGAYGATKIFVDTAQQYTPDVKLKAEPAAMLNYDKNADTVLDKNGELQLWFPPEEKAA